jgi:hypothetical protein
MVATNCNSAVLVPVTLVLNSHFTGSIIWAWVKRDEKRKKEKRKRRLDILVVLINEKIFVTVIQTIIQVNCSYTTSA